LSDECQTKFTRGIVATPPAEQRYLLFLVVFLVVFLALLPDDFLAVLFFAMALLPPFLRAKCKARKIFRQCFFAAVKIFLRRAARRARCQSRSAKRAPRACERAARA
jgi:hypothetical protein